MPANLPRLSELPPSAWAVAAALLLLALMLLLRRVWTWLLGPVFVWETERLARRGSTFWMRVIFIFALLAALYSAWPAEAEISPDAKSQAFELAGKQVVRLGVMRTFSLNFSHSFVFTHAVIVLLFIPLYFGGAITQEKENRTLDFLLVTKLRARDIILGKFGSRVLSLFAVEFGAIPVLAVTLLFGGVDLPRLIAGFAATALTILSFGSFAMLCSVLSRRTWTAIAVCFVLAAIVEGTCWLVGVGDFSSPITFYIRLQRLLWKATTDIDAINIISEQLALYAAVHLLLTLFFLGFAWAKLRRFGNRGLIASFATSEKRRKPPTESETLKRRRVYRTRAIVPRVDQRPVIWKERFLGRTIVGSTLHLVATLFFVVFALVLTGFAFLTYPDPSDGFYVFLTDCFRGLVVVAGVFLMLGLGLRLAGAFSREREQRTLETLMTIPGSRREILHGKWIGAWLRMGRYAVGALFAIALATYKGGADWRLSPVLVLAITTHAVFAANLGLYLSLICRSTVQAYITFFLILLVLLVGTGALVALSNQSKTFPSSLAYHGRWDNEPNEEPYLNMEIVSRVLNPVLTWWALLSPAKTLGSARTERDAMVFCIGLLSYSIVASVLWLLANRRMRWEATRA